MTASFLRDTARSLRSWRRTPGSALLVILALGLSGGALIALVSLFNALFWRELPVLHPKELVGVSAIDGRTPAAGSIGIPAGLFASLNRAENAFEAFAGFQRLNRQRSSRTPVNDWRSMGSAVAISTRSAWVPNWAGPGRARRRRCVAGRDD